jgi:hydrogenase expression/formation protein HypE
MVAMSDSFEIDQRSCPLPRCAYPSIVLGHGGGGRLTSDLVENLFVPMFRNEALAGLGDSVVLPSLRGRLAFSTDSFVVRPLFFPGGCIGDLAVNGTVNDLAMSGARPRFLSAGFIIEEGFSMQSLQLIVHHMAEAARRANVEIVAGDTKVVDKGHGDGCYINTAGIGETPDGLTIGPRQARAGDAIIVSGAIADHGMAIMSVREGLEFESTIRSDTAPLHDLVALMLSIAPDIHVLRDPTRGGVASALNEIAAASRLGMVLKEADVPVNSVTRAACDVFGLDPLFVANEGKLVAIVPRESADPLVATMRTHPLARDAAVIGWVTSEHPGIVVLKTAVGGQSVLAMQIGEQLPRIC